eukprot:354809-Pelagomonas_calceolata.AAC.5
MGACTDIVKFAESATMRGSVDWAALSMTPLASLGVASCWTAAATSSLCPSSSRCAHDWLLDNHCYHRAGVTSARSLPASILSRNPSSGLALREHGMI